MHVLPASPLEACLFIIGVAMGLLFALDGWSGSRTTKSLKDSPRLRNFKYAAGAAFVAFIADLKTLGITTGKDRLLHVYLEGFSFFSILTIGGIAAVIWYQFRALRRELPGISFPGSNPWLHYIIYGYSDYVEKLTAAKEAQAQIRSTELADYQKFIQGFLTEYNKQVTRSIAATNYALNGTPEVRRQTAQSILIAVEAVIMAYNKRRDGLKINVNYMRACRIEDATDAMKAQTRFFHGEWSDYEHLLVLEQYASDQESETFGLAVRKRAKDAEDYLLPGAPTAFYHNRAVIVDDTGHPAFAKKLAVAVAAEIRRYFSGKTFKSFLSMPIIHHPAQCGVLNIEASQEHAFGRNAEEREAIVSLVSPLCYLLGYLIKA